MTNTQLTFEEVYKERDPRPEGLLHSEEGPPTVELLRLHPLTVALIAVSVVLLLVLGMLIAAVLLSTQGERSQLGRSIQDMRVVLPFTGFDGLPLALAAGFAGWSEQMGTAWLIGRVVGACPMWCRRFRREWL